MSNYKKTYVGGAWKKEYGDGVQYLSVSLELDKLFEANGGATNGKVNLAIYKRTREKTNPKQPDYDLVFSEKQGADQSRGASAPLPLDDDIPFAWIVPFVLPATGLLAAMLSWT
jgi:hypothetical protein